jgi:hypothetical protein
VKARSIIVRKLHSTFHCIRGMFLANYSDTYSQTHISYIYIYIYIYVCVCVSIAWILR